MQRRFIMAGIACLFAAGGAGAQSMPNDPQQSDAQQATASQQQANQDSAIGGAADTKSQYGSPRTITSDPNCSFRPACDVFFGN